MLEPGKRIADKYLIKDYIAESLSSSIFLVSDPSGKEFAAKVIAQKREEKFGIYERETRILKNISHPNIVRLVDAGKCVENSCFFIVTEFIHGKSLKKYLMRYQAPGQRLHKMLTLLSQILPALNYIHVENYVHKDIKPSNILIDESTECPYLMDFGIAKIIETVTTSTDSDFYSPAYISPEQLKKQRITPQTDIYQLGISLLEVLGEDSLFKKYINDELDLNEYIDSVCADYDKFGDDVESSIRNVLRKMLMRNPENRYSSSEELKNEIIQIKNLLPFKKLYEICVSTNAAQSIKDEVPDIYADYDVKEYLQKSLNTYETYAEYNDSGDKEFIDITTNEFHLRAKISDDGSHLFAFTFFSEPDDRVRRFGIKIEDHFCITTSSHPQERNASDAFEFKRYLLSEKKKKRKLKANKKKDRDFLEKSETFLNMERQVYESKKFTPLIYQVSEHLRGDNKLILKIIDDSLDRFTEESFRKDNIQDFVQKLIDLKLLFSQKKIHNGTVLSLLNNMVKDNKFVEKHRDIFFRNIPNFKEFRLKYNDLPKQTKIKMNVKILLDYFSKYLIPLVSNIELPNLGVDVALFQNQEDNFPEIIGKIDQKNESNLEVIFDYDPDGRVKAIDSKKIPKRGYLKQFSTREESLLKKQEFAIRNLKNQNSVVTDLLPKLSRIEMLPPKEEIPGLTRYFDNNLDINQRKAVDKCLALQSGEFMCIQGPPGTGKTTVITEVIKQIIARYGKSKILVASQSNQAVDNVLEKIKDHDGVYLARLGLNEKAMSKIVREYTYDAVSENMLDQIVENIKESSIRFEHYAETTEKNHALQEIRSNWVKQLQGRNEELEKLLLKNINVLFATLVGIANRKYSFLNERFDYVIIDEAGRNVIKLTARF